MGLKVIHIVLMNAYNLLKFLIKKLAYYCNNFVFCYHIQQIIYKIQNQIKRVFELARPKPFRPELAMTCLITRPCNL